MEPTLARSAHRLCRAAPDPRSQDKKGEAPFSVDANLLHASSEGKVLENPAEEVPNYVYSAHARSARCTDAAAYIALDFERGDAVALDGKRFSPAQLLTELNQRDTPTGIGRLDLVENRFRRHEIARNVRDAGRHHPDCGASRDRNSSRLTAAAAHLRRADAEICELIYDGFWFAPEREMLQAAIDKSHNS